MQTSDLVVINFILPSSIDTINFCGVHDSNLRCIERITGSKIIPNHDGSLTIKGNQESVLYTKKVMDKMLPLDSYTMTHKDIDLLSQKIFQEKEYRVQKMVTEGLVVSKNHRVKAYTKNQEEYIQKILMHDITFGIGPAGTGKTYIAVAMALRELKLGNIKKVILTRPIIETDEHLGFLPGTLEDKIDPYIRPLYDALYSMMSLQEFDTMMQQGQIELAPLAYMRGRTLTNSFIILDEAQSATANQMKMFLTRLGQNAKMVITGDITQSDLQKGTSGLVDAIDKLKNIKEIGIHQFNTQDTVRHGLVKKIIEAYY